MMMKEGHLYVRWITSVANLYANWIEIGIFQINLKNYQNVNGVVAQDSLATPTAGNGTG
jgi:hypothetical protein